MARVTDFWKKIGDTIQPVFTSGVNLLISGTNRYLNFNSDTGETGYGLRDNGGTIQVKNSGGSWSNIATGGGEANTADNLGTGEGVFAGKVGVDLQFKSLKAGTGVTLSSDANEVTINSTGGGGGEANTTSNDGTGEGLAKAKVGVDLPFKSLVGGTGITLSSDANEVTINRDALSASDISDFDTEVSNNTDVAANTTYRGVGHVPLSQKGAADGVAELDSGGKVPSAQLPAFVDDILEYANLAAFPGTGETGKIYIALDTNLTYRWSGSAYVEISASLALGETSSTAYRGDRGKTAYDHSQTTGNPHSTAIGDISGLQDALDGKQTESVVVSSSLTAVLDTYYVNVANATYTDPTPAEGKGFIVFVRNGTATVGGTGYGTAGTIIHRIFHSGSWSNYVYNVSGTYIPAFADPNADRIVFWDDSAGAFAALTASTGLTISGTNMTVRTASASQTGIVELATDAETVTGTDTARATTPANITSRLAAPGTIGGTTPGAATFTSVDYNNGVGAQTDHGLTSGSQALDWNTKQHVIDLNGNTTITFSNAADGKEIRVTCKYNAATNLTWPTMTWMDNNNGSAPTEPSGAGEVMNAVIWQADGVIYGSASGNYAVYS